MFLLEGFRAPQVLFKEHSVRYKIFVPLIYIPLSREYELVILTETWLKPPTDIAFLA